MKNLINFLATTNRLKIAIWLCISILGGFALLYARIQVTGLFYFRFLVWNMFLAFIPYAVSTWLAYYSQTRKNSMVLMAGAAFWMLFFPNAPYIITDLFHLRERPQIPLWYDLLLILTFAWNGLMLAYVSLADMQEIATKLFNRFTGWVFVLGSLCLTGFGVYLGRFLRWNSWNIVDRPEKLVYDIADRVLNPFDHGRTWYFTLAFAAFLIIGYLTIYNFGGLRAKRPPTNTP